MIDKLKLAHINHAYKIKDKDKCILNKENSNCSWEDFSWLKWTQFVKASVIVTMCTSVKYY